MDPDYTIENGLLSQGFQNVCGVDEAGRGPLAGPVFAAAVILAPGTELTGVNDSKKLSEKKREALFDVICEKALAYAIASASPKEIDELNILQATFLAMRRAVAGLHTVPGIVLVDGNRKPGTGLPEETIVKGDAKCISIAAASILAKVSRDRVMQTLNEQYPEYAFSQHKGYPTKLHYERIAQYGPCPEHRKSFLKTLDKHI
ncbi:MAG: ribonuclease HII [Clostridia bacterium]|nr:ribonuclease HII [Clostridia bacterium]MBR0509034.1 ribonuclease HII [Clostridia bacterium]MBR0537717.1 ribonuclease HII [Clostridia bacterium]